jgi:hypothetical protein
MTYHMKRMNQELTRRLVDAINKLPPPVKAVVGFIPGGGLAIEYADWHNWAVIRLAEQYQKEMRLSPEGSRALAAYKSAVEAESRAYEQLIRAIGH